MKLKNHVKRSMTAAICAAFISSAGVAASAQEMINLTLATGLPPTLLVQKEASDTFAPAVNEELKKMGSKYRINWTIGHAGTIVKLPGIMQAITDGIIDVGVTTQALEQSKMPLQNVVYKVPFGTTDHNAASEIFHETQNAVPAMDVWAKNNSVFLGAFPFDRYILMSKTPINSVKGLKGKKVGGIGPNLLWLQNTGAVGVVSNFGTAYDDLQSGKIDLTFSTPTVAASTRIQEVAPYLIDVGFGSVSVQIALFNKKRFDALPTDVQKAIKLAGKKWEAANLRDLDARLEAAMVKMKKAGATFITFSDDKKQEWANTLPPMAEKWIAKMEAKGLPGRQVVDAYKAAHARRGIKFARDWAGK